MAKIKCDHCGTELKYKDIVVVSFYKHEDDIKYKDYTATCSKCGGVISWDRYVQKAAENKAKALEKFARKKGKSAAQITEAKQYDAIMQRISSNIVHNPDNFTATIKQFNKAINELPDEEKRIVLAYEDKKDMEIIKGTYYKSTKNVTSNSVLLLTQAIIESAIIDKDECFFASNYGKNIVDMYNAALTLHIGHDYEITADLLLEKMQKGTITFYSEETRRTV
jgi:transcriptional regulator with GAF, ATPase, and Fis domain